MKCIIPNCNRELSASRIKAKRVTCSKKCSSNWYHMAIKTREKLRGKRYNLKRYGDKK